MCVSQLYVCSVQSKSYYVHCTIIIIKESVWICTGVDVIKYFSILYVVVFLYLFCGGGLRGGRGTVQLVNIKYAGCWYILQSFTAVKHYNFWLGRGCLAVGGLGRSRVGVGVLSGLCNFLPALFPLPLLQTRIIIIGNTFILRIMLVCMNKHPMFVMLL